MTGSGDDASAEPDFFVSYTRSDERWAEWIGWVLEDAGHRVVMQAWDFGAGAHFVAEMQRATERAVRTVAVLSAAYQASAFAAEEWQAAWVQDPDGRGRKLLAFRVEDCPRTGLLRQLVAVDLFGVGRDAARERLLAAMREKRRKPEDEPLFPEPSGGANRPEPPMPVPPEVWRMPWPRNPNFVGRADELAGLRERFTAGAGTAVVLPQAVHGLGGVGKTQLAVEYAYRHAADYGLIWWVPAEQPALIVAALADLAAELGLARVGEAQESAAAAVEELRRSRRFPRWLVIADNAGAVSDLCGLLAAAGASGHVMITSRDPGWSRAAHGVAVDVLPRARAVELLQARAPRLTPEQADRIADALGDLPLALEQAGAWLAESGMSVAAYLDALDRRTREILAEGVPSNYPVPVAATWTLALNEIDETVVALLRLWAFLGPEPIPTDLITDESARNLSGALTALADPIARGRAVAASVRLGLVRFADDEDAVVMHRLVQAVLRDHTPEAERPRVREAAAMFLAAAAPDSTDDPAQWPRWVPLHQHALAVGIVDIDRHEARVLVFQLCNYLSAAGSSVAGGALANDAYRCWNQLLDEDHLHTMKIAAHRAAALWSAGEYAAAQEIEEDVLARRRRVLGDDHPDTLSAAANLATTLWSVGNHATAREMQQDVLARRGRVLGEDDPDTMLAAANLATTLWSVGDHVAASSMLSEVLVRYARVLGDDHPDTMWAAANLAAMSWAAGDHLSARNLLQDVLNRYRSVLGEEHPSTVRAATRLAEWNSELR